MSDSIIVPAINVIAFQEAGGWVAQCLQYDIAVQADTLPELQREFRLELVGHVLLNIEHGRGPFDGLAEAPPKFWKMYSDGIPLDMGGEQPASPGKPSVPPVRYKTPDDSKECAHPY